MDLHQFSLAALQSLPDAITLVDEKQIVQFINPAAAQLLSTDETAPIGKSIKILPGADGLKTYEEKIAFYEQRNQFALNKIPIPEFDRQVWSAMVNNRWLEYVATPI